MQVRLRQKSVEGRSAPPMGKGRGGDTWHMGMRGGRMQNLNSPTVSKCMFERDHSAVPPTELSLFTSFSFCLDCCRSTYRNWLPEGRELFIEHLLQAHCRAVEGLSAHKTPLPSSTSRYKWIHISPV